MNSDGVDIFATGFLVGCLSAAVLFFVLSFLLIHDVVEHSFQSRLADAGIRLEHHYIEKDGVRTNWTDVVFINKEERNEGQN